VGENLEVGFFLIAEARRSGSAEKAHGTGRGGAFGANHWLRHPGASGAGSGFLEKVYEEAMGMELAKVGLDFERQKVVVLVYDGKPIGEHRLDLLVEARVVLELKACRNPEDIHLATARSYLKATGCPVSLVMNFAKPTLEIRRVVLSF
jgi:GxxExxY protein